MSKKKVEEIVAEVVKPIVETHEFELIDVEYIKENSDWYLRIYIDKIGGITIDDCQLVSEEVSSILDDINPIPQQYYLEVSSPGLDRPLETERDFIRYQGEKIEIKLYTKMDGHKMFQGTLEGLQDNKIVITTDEGKTEKFDRKDVALVKRWIKF